MNAYMTKPFRPPRLATTAMYHLIETCKYPRHWPRTLYLHRAKKSGRFESFFSWALDSQSCVNSRPKNSTSSCRRMSHFHGSRRVTQALDIFSITRNNTRQFPLHDARSLQCLHVCRKDDANSGILPCKQRLQRTMNECLFFILRM